MNSGFCSLVFKGSGLDIDQVEKTMDMKASIKFVQGEVVSSVIGKSTVDLIQFNFTIDDACSPEDAINNMLDAIYKQLSFVNYMREKYDVKLTCFVQSDYAQISYNVSSTTLRRVGELGFDMRISIFSWGGADIE